MEEVYPTNAYLKFDHIVANVNECQEKKTLFVEFAVINGRKYGCVYATKRRNNFLCKLCRKLHDKKRYDNKKKSLTNADDSTIESSSNVPEPEESSSDMSTSKETPSTFTIISTGIKWYNRKHLPECTLISNCDASLGSLEELVIIPTISVPTKPEPSSEEIGHTSQFVCKEEVDISDDSL